MKHRNTLKHSNKMANVSVLTREEKIGERFFDLNFLNVDGLLREVWDAYKHNGDFLVIVGKHDFDDAENESCDPNEFRIPLVDIYARLEKEGHCESVEDEHGYGWGSAYSVVVKSPAEDVWENMTVFEQLQFLSKELGEAYE